MSCFDKSSDDVDSFLYRFEVYADSRDGKKDSGQYICQHF